MALSTGLSARRAGFRCRLASCAVPHLGGRQLTLKVVLDASMVLWLLLLASLCVVVGHGVLALSGLLLWLRQGRDALRLSYCQPPRPLLGLSASVLILTTIVVSKLGLPSGLPWQLLPLLLVSAPPLLHLLGPPRAHMDRDQQRHVGTYNAWSHYYGYLTFFRDDNSARYRLCQHKGAGADNLHCKSVVVLWPLDGYYPDHYSDLEGVSEERGFLQEFQETVAGNVRNYGKFKIHDIQGSDGRQRRVALDRVSALSTLRKMAEHAPVGLRELNCQQQMQEMLITMRNIVEQRRHLKGQLLLVTYRDGEHVGDRILDEMGVERTV